MPQSTFKFIQTRWHVQTPYAHTMPSPLTSRTTTRAESSTCTPCITRTSFQTHPHANKPPSTPTQPFQNHATNHMPSPPPTCGKLGGYTKFLSKNMSYQSLGTNTLSCGMSKGIKRYANARLLIE